MPQQSFVWMFSCSVLMLSNRHLQWINQRLLPAVLPGINISLVIHPDRLSQQYLDDQLSISTLLIQHNR